MNVNFDTLRTLCIIAEEHCRTESNPDIVHDWFLDENGTLVPDKLADDPDAKEISLDEFAKRAFLRWSKGE